jgi:hypothetical protein
VLTEIPRRTVLEISACSQTHNGYKYNDMVSRLASNYCATLKFFATSSTFTLQINDIYPHYPNPFFSVNSAKMKATLFTTLLFAMLGMTIAQTGCENQYVNRAKTPFFLFAINTDLDFAGLIPTAVLATTAIAPPLVSCACTCLRICRPYTLPND